jgi:Transglutaminase-like superfamily
MKHNLLTHFLTILGFILPPLSIGAQSFERIDSLVFNIPELATRAPEDLVAFGKVNTRNQTELVRFFYVWIARNIRYDNKAYLVYRQNGGLDIAKQAVPTVWQTREAVCSGYARLFETLCQQAEIPARYVAGHAKTQQAPNQIEPHAWNAIRIDNEWALFDVTWASNSLRRDSSHLSTIFERWWMSGPEDFSRQHLPYDPVFQMTKDLTTRAEFFGETDGSSEISLDFNAEKTLDEEIKLDSLEYNWRSYRRAHVFSTGDTVVATKLARLQDERAKAAFKVVEEFMQGDLKTMSTLSREQLQNWLNRFLTAKEPAREALLLHAEIEDLPVNDRVVEVVQKNRRRLVALAQFMPALEEELRKEIAKRQ